MRSTSRLFVLAFSLASVGSAATARAASIAFDLPADYAGGSFPFGMALADLNGDAWLDLAVTNPDAFTTPHAISILLNAGNGTFLPAASFVTGETTRSIAATDLDADGDVDLVVGYQEGEDRLGILRNDGFGVFSAPELLAPVAGRADAVAVLDLDGDADLDFLIGQAGGDEIVVVKNDGGSYAAPVTYGGTSSAYFLHLSVGDIDGDGDADVAVGRSLSTASTYTNLGDGTFAPPVALAVVPFGYAGCDLGDVDGDGDLDLAFIHQNGGQVLFARNTGSGSFELGGVFPAGVDTQLGTPLTLADLDGDGRSDAIVPGANTYRVVTLRSAGSGFEAAEAHALGGLARKVKAADLDNDGDADLVGSLANFGRVSVLRNQAIDVTSALDALPSRGLSLGPARPNPVRVATTIPFDLPAAVPLRLTVVDVQGRHVRSLADGVVAAGQRAVTWDARDERGADVAAGVYFVKLEAGALRAGSQIVVVR